MTPVATSSLVALIEERLALASPLDGAAAARLVTILLEAAVYGPAGPARRRPVISPDGTPLSVSLQEDGRPGAPAFRLLVEPGLPSLSVAEQIDHALTVLDRLLGELGWRSLADSVNAVTHALFPADAAAVQDWWGGIGLGCVASDTGLELRAYFNLRNGAVPSRWQRFSAALSALTGDAVDRAAFDRLIERVAPHGVPAGVALSWFAGRLRGIRLYVALGAPSAAAICAVGAVTSSHQRRTVEAICADYEDEVRPFGYECVTMAFDFPMRPDGACDLKPARVKADFDCASLNDGRPGAARRTWLAAQHRHAGLPHQRLDALLDTLQKYVGGSRVDYLSLGLRGAAAELTTYLIPDGYHTLR